ncbi:MAG: hypothetical protein U1E78_10180 [Gammaproteobacteria bacterium]
MFTLSFIKDKLSTGYQFTTGSISPHFTKKLFKQSGKLVGSLLGQSSLGKIIGSALSGVNHKGFNFNIVKRSGYRCLAKECAKNSLGKTAVASAIASFIFDIFYESESDLSKISRNIDKAAFITSLQLLLSNSIEAAGQSAGQYIGIQTGLPYAGAFAEFLVQAGCQSTLAATTACVFEKCMPREVGALSGGALLN